VFDMGSVVSKNFLLSTSIWMPGGCCQGDYGRYGVWPLTDSW